MNKAFVLAVAGMAALLTGSLAAEPASCEGPGGVRGSQCAPARPEGGQKGPRAQFNPAAVAPVVAAKLADKDFLAGLGVPENKREKIAARAAKLSGKFKENGQKLRDLKARGAVRAALASPDGDLAQAEEQIKQAGRLRTERELLAFRFAAFARRALDDGQRAKLREALKDARGARKGPKAGFGPKGQKGPKGPKAGLKGPEAKACACGEGAACTCPKGACECGAKKGPRAGEGRRGPKGPGGRRGKRPPRAPRD